MYIDITYFDLEVRDVIPNNGYITDQGQLVSFNCHPFCQLVMFIVIFAMGIYH